MASTKEIGNKAEEIACDFLKKKRYKIIDKNWRAGRLGEVDIITIDTKTKELVFVEVKSRRTSTLHAKELITEKKKVKLTLVAKAYLNYKKLFNSKCRFDVVAIKLGENSSLIEHIRHAF